MGLYDAIRKVFAGAFGDGTLQHDIREAEEKLEESLSRGHVDPTKPMDQILADDGEFCDEEQLRKSKFALRFVVEISSDFWDRYLGSEI